MPWITRLATPACVRNRQESSGGRPKAKFFNGRNFPVVNHRARTTISLLLERMSRGLCCGLQKGAFKPRSHFDACRSPRLNPNHARLITPKRTSIPRSAPKIKSVFCGDMIRIRRFAERAASICNAGMMGGLLPPLHRAGESSPWGRFRSWATTITSSPPTAITAMRWPSA